MGLRKFLTTRLVLIATAMAVLAVIWISTEWRIDAEYHRELATIDRQNDNLVRAFEESARNQMRALDEILHFLKSEYEQHGYVTPEMLLRMQSTRHMPIVHISVINDQGIISRSSLPMLLAMNVSDMEYFKAFREKDYTAPYFAKPVIGRATKKWLFHISRRLNRPDGSMAGAINIGIDPTYFAGFFSQMDLGDRYAVSIIGRDGYVRIRQTATTTEVGTDIRNEPYFKQVLDKSSGSFVTSPAKAAGAQFMTFRALQDYPLIVTLSLAADEAMADWRQRKINYRSIASLGSLVVAILFLLLLRMVRQQLTHQRALQQANDDLEKKVAERTAELETSVRELKDALDEVKTLRGIVPICAWCRKVRDDQGYWKQVERYVSDHTLARFSHGLCPDCFDAQMDELKTLAEQQGRSFENGVPAQDRPPENAG
jgi:hypothetical protein